MQGPSDLHNFAINLARADGFQIGQLVFIPASREMRFGGDTHRVEPRVMQVLICLHGADGRVVAREDLLKRCWGGCVVSEDAIQRAISKARKLLALDGDFAIGTVSRVGYRLQNRSKGDLATMIAAISDANLHDEISLGEDFARSAQ
jgi:DNA-binding winged helix-turn-helix (wHTH) protein